MANRVDKLSISVPSDLAAALRRRVGPRGLSGFVATAIQHELEREQLEGLLRELDDEHGPVPAKELDEARQAWPKR